MNFNGVLIGSDDPKGLAAFYTKVIGEPTWDQNGFVGWEAGGSYFMVGPHSDVKGRNEMPARILVNFETKDVQGEFKRVKGLGASVVAEPYNPGGSDQPEMLLATFEDPDGNYFQLASPMPDA